MREPTVKPNIVMDPARALPTEKGTYKLVVPQRASSPQREGIVSAAGAPTPTPTVTPGISRRTTEEAADDQPSHVRPAAPDLSDAHSVVPLQTSESAASIAASSSSLPLPLLRGRERVQLFKRCPLLAELPEAALQRLAALVVEKTLNRYNNIRPQQSLFVHVYGSLTVQQGGFIPLTREMPPELLATAPDASTAQAIKAVAMDGAVAGSVSESGATLGLADLVGGLVAAPPSFLVLEKALLLQLPLEAVRNELEQPPPMGGPPVILEARRRESRLRMLLALKAVQEAQAPVEKVRALAGSMRLVSVPMGEALFSAGDKAHRTLILIHGRVDLYDQTHHRIFNTVDATMAPPLGEMPNVTTGGKPFTQHVSAIAAEACLLLSGGLDAARNLLRLLAASSDEAPGPDTPEAGYESSEEEEGNAEEQISFADAVALKKMEEAEKAAFGRPSTSSRPGTVE